MVENLEHRLRVTPEMASIKSAYDRVFINGFTTIAKPLLEFKTGERKVLSETWHKVKGWGDAPFDVLFNPDKQQWLKIVPPGVEGYKAKRGLLIEGAKIVRTSLSTSGLQNYAEKVEECSVKIDGSPTVGFKTNHLGPTQDFIIRQLSKSKTGIDFETAAALSTISIEAFNLAAERFM